MDRKLALRAYLTEVVRDLMIRGAIRSQQGWTLDRILRTDGRTVINQVFADLAEVSGQIAGELLRGVGGLVEARVGGFIHSLAESIAGRRK